MGKRTQNKRKLQAARAFTPGNFGANKRGMADGSHGPPRDERRENVVEVGLSEYATDSENNLAAASRIREKMERESCNDKNNYTLTPFMSVVALTSRTACLAATYPFEMTRCLLRIGYEPKPPELAPSFFGRPTLQLMNQFSILKYIKRVDGLAGCFRGFTTCLMNHIAYTNLQSAVAGQMTRLLNMENLLANELPSGLVSPAGYALRRRTLHEGAERHSLVTDDSDSDEGFTEEEDDDSVDADTKMRRLTLELCVKSTLRSILARSVASIVCYPIRTMSTLTIAEFVGRDGIMSRGIFAGAVYIYRRNGIRGFYGGFMPKLLGEVTTMLAVGIIDYFIRVGVDVDCFILKSCLRYAFNYLLSAVVYPFVTVSSTMAVCGSGLKAGRLPHMEEYKNWRECWSHLSKLNMLDRGSSLIFRQYKGPVSSTGQVLGVRGIYFGPDFTTGLTGLSQHVYDWNKV